MMNEIKNSMAHRAIEKKAILIKNDQSIILINEELRSSTGNPMELNKAIIKNQSGK